MKVTISGRGRKMRIGATKTIKGKTYRLNKNKRWERKSKLENIGLAVGTPAILTSATGLIGGSITKRVTDYFGVTPTRLKMSTKRVNLNIFDPSKSMRRLGSTRLLTRALRAQKGFGVVSKVGLTLAIGGLSAKVIGTARTRKLRREGKL